MIQKTKHFKGKKVPKRNASRNTSKKQVGISRTKKASPELLEMIEMANLDETGKQELVGKEFRERVDKLQGNVDELIRRNPDMSEDDRALLSQTVSEKRLDALA